MTEKQKTSYHIGNISLDAEGVFWIHFMGVNRGETDLKPIIAGHLNIETLKNVFKSIQRGKPQLLDQIKELEKSTEDKH